MFSVDEEDGETKDDKIYFKYPPPKKDCVKKKKATALIRE